MMTCYGYTETWMDLHEQIVHEGEACPLCTALKASREKDEQLRAAPKKERDRCRKVLLDAEAEHRAAAEEIAPEPDELDDRQEFQDRLLLADECARLARDLEPKPEPPAAEPAIVTEDDIPF